MVFCFSNQVKNEIGERPLYNEHGTLTNPDSVTMLIFYVNSAIHRTEVFVNKIKLTDNMKGNGKKHLENDNNESEQKNNNNACLCDVPWRAFFRKRNGFLERKMYVTYVLYAAKA